MTGVFTGTVRLLAALGVAALALSAASAARADAAKGAAIAQNGLPDVAPCSACHGPDGEGMAGVAPRLAGLSKAYFLSQLTAFRTGARKNSIMKAIAADLTPAQGKDAADYYNAATASSHPVAADAALLKVGQQIAAGGRPSTGLPACDVCHGAGGSGVGPSVPYLAGRDAGYIRREIEAWRQGLRSDPLGMMKPVADKLSADDVVAVAAYYASLPAPKRQAAK
jgi:cytochrome c553